MCPSTYNFHIWNVRLKKHFNQGNSFLEEGKYSDAGKLKLAEPHMRV